MKYEIVTLEAKRMVGFCARTGNKEENMSGVIGGLWQQWEGMTLEEGGKYIGLYSDYEGMTYNVTVGREVEESTPIPKGMVEKRIPQGKYAKFVIHGDVVQAVQRAWTEIWEMPLERTFTGDFEEYQEGTDLENMEIHIYVAMA